MSAKTTLSKIEERLGFVPPFFTPAAEHPELLESFWQQTQSAYLDNPLPSLFKEKLAALLGRYCEVPYCLVCHTCSLRPLGMSGAGIVELLVARHASDEKVTEALDRLSADDGTIDLGAGERHEQDIFCLASAVYAGNRLAAASRARLRQRLSSSTYGHLITFISYNRMCHDWMAAHPEVSYKLDQRYLQHHGPLAAEAPAITDFFAELRPSPEEDRVQRIHEVVSARTAEAASSIAISERRFLDVVATLKARVASAIDSANEKEQLALELGRTANFAQELLAIVSHDLRSPLSSVLMGVQVILDLETHNEQAATTIALIASSARRAERLIQDLLDFSQARVGGGIPIHHRPVELQAVVRSVVDEVQLTHPGHTIRVEHHGDGHGEWDADRLAQILSNLLSNAMAHGRSDAPIELSTRGNDESVTIAVHNANADGPIPEDLLPVLFDPFKRGAEHSATSGGGIARSVGLGLYIVSEIVRGHRGKVSVVSSANGTTFTVELPRTPSRSSARSGTWQLDLPALTVGSQSARPGQR